MYGGPLGTICHNPACGTWRNSLAPIRNSGCEAAVIHSLEIQPSRDTLGVLIADMGQGQRAGR